MEDIKIDTTQFPGPFEIKECNEWLQHAITDLRIKHALFDPLTEGCEATRREFISAVLVLAATLVGNVKLAVEELVVGSLGKGPVDWVALFEGFRICITEGKKDNLTQGQIQNIAQLAASREHASGKRKFVATIPTYGIATTYLEWTFFKLTDGPRQLFRSSADTISIDQHNLQHTVRDVASRIAAILQEQKDAVISAKLGSASCNKKTKT